MIESDHHPSLHVDFGKLQPKLASYVNYLFARSLNTPHEIPSALHGRTTFQKPTTALDITQESNLRRRHLGKISNGHISATGRPIHSMFGSRVGFSGTADLMALFPVRKMQDGGRRHLGKISNGHISATGRYPHVWY